MLQFELEAGQSLHIDHLTLTIVDIHEDEICVKIEDESSLFPIRLYEMLPRVPK